MIKLLSFIICLLLLGGQVWAADTIKDGFYSDYDAKGTSSERWNTVMACPTGVSVLFILTAALRAWGGYLNGKLEGMAQGYYPSGVLSFKSFYSEGQLHGAFHALLSPTVR